MTDPGLLGAALGHAVDAMRFAVRDLSEDEFSWEPVSPCWSVRRVEGRWVLDDRGPPLPTTIGWRFAHVVIGLEVYGAVTFEGSSLRWADVEPPGSASAALGRLVPAQDRLLAHVQSLVSGIDLSEPRPAHWGQRLPLWQLVWTMVVEQLHHGAEIGVLRDLRRGHASTAWFPELQEPLPDVAEGEGPAQGGE